MKLVLTGPQAITIFGVQKDELVPATAKSSSYATPQAYYCTDTGNLYMYIKGQEYKFSTYEEHVENMIHTDPDAMHTKVAELETKVEDLTTKVHNMHHMIFEPLHNAFSSHVDKE